MSKPLLMLLMAVICNMAWLFSSEYAGRRAGAEEGIVIPEQYRHLLLVKCAPSKLEREFAKQFPSKIETYKHPDGLIILRQVTGATRRLHNTRVCLKSGGYELSNIELVSDAELKQWQSYTAEKPGERLDVKSIILAIDSEESWHSVEQWFWQALFSNRKNVYLAVTEIKGPM